MPLPKTTDPGKIINKLKKEKPNMPHKQRIAIALSQARKSGAKIPNLRKARMSRLKARVERY